MTTLLLTFGAETVVPDLGPVSANAGSGWLEVGNITAVRRLPDGRLAVELELLTNEHPVIVPPAQPRLVPTYTEDNADRGALAAVLAGRNGTRLGGELHVAAGMLDALRADGWMLVRGAPE